MNKNDLISRDLIKTRFDDYRNMVSSEQKENINALENTLNTWLDNHSDNSLLNLIDINAKVLRDLPNDLIELIAPHITQLTLSH